MKTRNRMKQHISFTLSEKIVERGAEPSLEINSNPSWVCKLILWGGVVVIETLLLDQIQFSWVLHFNSVKSQNFWIHEKLVKTLPIANCLKLSIGTQHYKLQSFSGLNSNYLFESKKSKRFQSNIYSWCKNDTKEKILTSSNGNYFQKIECAAKLYQQTFMNCAAKF